MTTPELPYNPDAECKVIAACFLRPDATEQYGLVAPDFYLARHQQLYRAILAMRRAEQYSRTALNDELRRTGDLDRIGLATVDGILATWAPSWETDEAAAIVKACAIRRALITAGGQIVTLAYQEAQPIDEQLSQAQTLLTAVSASHTTSNAVELGDALDTWYTMATSDTGDGQRWQTGFPDLDSVTGGVWASELIVLAAATSVGKTALALSIADHIIANDAPVVWFSLEMPREQLINRLVSIHTGINAADLRLRKLRPGDLPRIADAMELLNRRPLVIDCASRSLAQIRTATQQQRAKRGKIGLVVVDHMGLMNAGGRYAGNRVNEVSELSRGLKELSMSLNAPVLALHQFNRAGSSEDDPTRIPLLSDLKDSSSVEQDADTVWLLHRPGTRSSNPAEQRKAVLYIAKQRNGPVSSIALDYHPITTHYRSIERYRGVDGYAH